MNLTGVNIKRRLLGKRPLGWSNDLIERREVFKAQNLIGLDVMPAFKSGPDYRWGHKRKDWRNGS